MIVGKMTHSGKVQPHWSGTTPRESLSEADVLFKFPGSRKERFNGVVRYNFHFFKKPLDNLRNLS